MERYAGTSSVGTQVWVWRVWFSDGNIVVQVVL